MGFFNELVIDPKDPNRVYAPFHNGVYRTTNGGTSWALMNFPGVSDTTIGGWSLSIDPQFSSTLLVSHTSTAEVSRVLSMVGPTGIASSSRAAAPARAR
jgi:hypothetical protein